MRAIEFQAHHQAGLILSADEYGKPEWVGKGYQFKLAERYLDFYENYGRFPVDDYPYREVEPNVFTK